MTAGITRGAAESSGAGGLGAASVAGAAVPGEAAFAALVAARRDTRVGADQPAVVPVVRELDADVLAAAGLGPVELFDLLAAGSEHAALLETRETGMGDLGVSVVVGSAQPMSAEGDVLAAVRAHCVDDVLDTGIDAPAFVGGAVGMLGHEYVTRLEPKVPLAAALHPAATADACFLRVDVSVVFEHRRRRVLAVTSVRVDPGDDLATVSESHRAALAELDGVVRMVEQAVRDSSTVGVDGEPVRAGAAPGAVSASTDVDPYAACTPNMTRAAFEGAVRDARELVLSGECVQIVVSQRFDRPCDATPLDVYRELSALSPAPYHALLRLGPTTLVLASPEQLVGVRDERIATHPIAGTRPRGRDEETDLAHEASLLADPKERAEHMMLVDLGRNDVGRASAPGTVEVAQLAQVERFSHVMHLVSRVEGALAPGLHPVDALTACFPAGTLTGAPKVRAMEHIARLEPSRRGAYGGVVGYVGHGRVLDMAITIRGAVLRDGLASVQAGAGVVAASDPALEYDETRHKARAVLLAIELAQRAHERAA